jgi:mRNA interferase YafQ
MYKILAKKEFMKSVSRLRAGKSWNEGKMRATLELLALGEPPPVIFRDHQLKAEMGEYRECHIKHDLLILYARDDERKIITLIDIGTHDDIFGR